MPLVFISHAHDDELLARAVCALLRDSLELSQADFFVSSVEGRGVAPAASIQQEVLTALASAPALIVVMTPRSALSRWVWLEVGSRLGQPAKPDPLIVCPAERFATLLGPIGDRKAVNLDNEDELVELVNAIAELLQRKTRDYLSYKPTLSELVRIAKTEYSPAREFKTRALSWTRQHWSALVLAPLMLVAGCWYEGRSARTAESALRLAEIQRNEDVAAVAARYLVLTGTVVSRDDNTPVSEALVMASKDPDVRSKNACVEPRCTSWQTDTEGKFSLDLTRIKALKEETISLVVMKSGFTPNVNLIRIDVRAMDATVAPQSVKLSGAPPAPASLVQPR